MVSLLDGRRKALSVSNKQKTKAKNKRDKEDEKLY